MVAARRCDRSRLMSCWQKAVVAGMTAANHMTTVTKNVKTVCYIKAKQIPYLHLLSAISFNLKTLCCTNIRDEHFLFNAVIPLLDSSFFSTSLTVAASFPSVSFHSLPT